MNRTLGRVAVLVMVSVGVVIAADQQPPTFSGNTRTVAVYATVDQRAGTAVTDLGALRRFFDRRDEGRPETLTVFSNTSTITAVILSIEAAA